MKVKGHKAGAEAGVEAEAVDKGKGRRNPSNPVGSLGRLVNPFFRVKTLIFITKNQLHYCVLGCCVFFIPVQAKIYKYTMCSSRG